jgi:hypothetical protein
MYMLLYCLYVFVAGEDALTGHTISKQSLEEKQSSSLKFEPILLSFFWQFIHDNLFKIQQWNWT